MITVGILAGFEMGRCAMSQLVEVEVGVLHVVAYLPLCLGLFITLRGGRRR